MDRAKETRTSNEKVTLHRCTFVGSCTPGASRSGVGIHLNSPLSDSRPYTLGFTFSTSTTFLIDGLGYWDNRQPGSHQVGIWDSLGNLLVSTTVLATDPVSGHFRYSSVSYSLTPGTYTITGEFLGDGTFNSGATGITSLPGYTWLSDVQQFGSGLNYPTFTTGSYGPNGIGEVNFTVGSGTSVPEVSSLLLLGSGLLGIVGTLRRKRIS